MKKLLACVLAAFAIAAVSIAVPASASADSTAAGIAKKGKGKKKNKKVFTVCKHGCKYKTVTKAAKKVKKKNSTIKIKPGTYKEGVIFEGHKYDGLTIKGTKNNAKKVVFEGKNAKSPDGLAQNAIEAINVNNLTLKNMTAQHFATNGFFVRDKNSGPGETIDCNDYVMDNLIVNHNRSYGLFAFGCAGGKMINSVGFGHGDSAFYVGATPDQEKPKTTMLKNIESYENVLGYSGTNSKYMVIKDSDFYNNGAGVVPNTLDSEPFEPAADSVLKNNNIFWNNFNYYLPNSGVKTVSDGLGEINGLTLNYPTGIGVVLFGADGWVVKNNQIFGNFKWGTALFSDPFNCEGPPGPDCPTGDDAMSQNNQIVDNQNGRNGTDSNAIDFWSDGSGSGNCFSGNTSSTNSGPTNGGVAPGHSEAFLYPTCPAPGSSGTGTPEGDPFQVGALIQYVGSTENNPPENQECSWLAHPHPPFENFEAIEVTPGPTCP